jgi:5-methylcytosine-specific restriction enzyme subunit McrC
MTIPVENLYYLLCYAWDYVDEGVAIAAGVEDSPEVADMLAHVLSRGVDTLLRRGISHRYQERHEVLRAVRGRIDVMETATSGLMRQGLVACDIEEFVRDTPENRVMRATLVSLHRIPTLTRDVKQHVQTTIECLWGITQIRLDAAAFRTIQLHQSSSLYGFLLQICRLVMRLLLPNEQDGSTRLRDLARDESMMARVFQKFLLNFFRCHRAAWRPCAEVIAWQAEAIGPDFVPSGSRDYRRCEVLLRGPCLEVGRGAQG